MFMIDYNVDTTQPPVGGSGLTVALNAGTPASASIPSTVSRVPFTKVNFTASNDGSVALEGLTITRSGLTTINNSVKVWVEHNGDALTTKRTVTNNEAILTFSPAITVGAGQTVTLDVLAELDDVTGNIALGIAGAAHVETNSATVSGSFPVTGNIMSITDYTVAELTLTGGDDDDYTVTVGDVEVELGRFDLEMGTTTRDLMLDSVMLRNTGVEDLVNVTMDMYLEEAGERVTEYASFDGRYATFTFLDDGYEFLEDDGEKTFVIKADIIDKESSAAGSLAFSLHRSEHLVAYESTTGFGVTYGHENNVDISTAEIESGVVTVSKKSTSPADDSVIAGQNNVVALLANIKADEAIFAEGLKVQYDGDEDSFRNVRVYLNNVLLDSFDLDASQTYNGGAYETKDIDTSISLNEGDNELKITVSVKSNADPSDKFRSQVIGTSEGLLVLPEYVSNGIFVDEEDVSGQADGALFTVEGGGLVVTRNDGYSDGRILIQGNQDVLLGKFAIKAENDAIKITSIALGENTGSATATPHASIYDMKLFVDGNQVGNTRNFGSGGATFSSLNYQISKDATKVFELKGSFDSSAAGTDSTYFETELTAYGQDSTGSSVDEQSDTSAEFEIKESGDLTVDIAPDTPNSDILIAHAGVEQELAQFRLTSQYDSANVTEIEVDLTTADEKTLARVSSFKLYDGTKLLDSVVPTATTTKFNIANNELLVEANSNKVVTVKAVFNEIEFTADSGAEYELTMTDLEAKGSNGALISSPTITTDSSNVMVLRKTKPTFSLVSGYDTAGADTEQEMLRFKISADANEDLQINTLTFTEGGTATGISETGDWVLYEVGNSTELATSTDGSFTSLGIEIGSGTDKSFYVVVDTSGVSVDERFGVSLRNDTAANISWKEYFVAGYGSAIDGEYLKTFPISGGTMTY